MEVVGVVAAVPGLVELVRHVATAAGQISSGTRMIKAVQGSQAQLQVLEQILASIQKRNETSSPNSILNTRLAPVLRDIQAEIEKLQRLITKVTESDGASRVLKRARLVLIGFEKQFTNHLRRIESATKLLQLYLSESTIQSDQKSQLGKLLHISTTYFIPEKLEGTCEWLWLHEAFKAWCRAETSSTSPPVGGAQPVSDRILSVYGVKGSGKSVLASSAVKELRSRGDVALFYSFWAGSSDTKQSITMFRDILWQMLNTLPEEVQSHHIARLLESCAELTVPNSVYLELHKLCKLHQNSLYIVLDGIDESIDDWNDMKNGPLATLMELSQKNDRLRLLLVGRQSSLRSALSLWPLSIEITKELIGEDLNRLISSEMGNCPNIKDLIVRERVQRELESRSSVMFLWIKLVFKQVRQSFCLSEINDTLSRPPNELNEEYSRLFAILVRRLGGHPKNPSVGMDRTKRLLQLIIGASRPLTMIELRLAYAYSCISTHTGSVDISPYFLDQEAVIDACGDFVTIQGDLIYFGHVSIREFLLRSPEQWECEDEGVQFFCLDSNSCQRMLGLTCLRYLKNIKWRRDGNTQCFNELTIENPLLHYASSYMISHILSSDPQFEETSKALEGFIDSTDMFDYINYVLSIDDNVTNNMRPLPLQFWDEVLHFLQAWDSFGLLETGADLTHIDDADHRNDRATCIESIRATFPLPQRHVERWWDAAVKDARNILPLDTHDAVKHMVSSQSKFSIRQLQLVILKVSTSLKTAEMLVRPVDILLQALEKSLRGMSFFALMACAITMAKISGRPAEALRIYEMAAEKVQNQGNLKEVWVLVCMANLLRGSSEICDEKRATNYYGQARDILAKIPQNPLVIIWWCEAAQASLVSVGHAQFDQFRELRREIESRLLSFQYPMQNPNIVRNVGYSMLWRSALITRHRMKNILLLKYIYEIYGRMEDVEKLMESIIKSESYIGSLDSLSQFECMDSLANAMYRLGKSQKARETWNKAAALLDGGIRSDRQLISRTTLRVVNSLYDEQEFGEVEKKLSSLANLSEFLQELLLDDELDMDFVDVSIRNMIKTYVVWGKEQQALHTMEACDPTILALMEKGRYEASFCSLGYLLKIATI
ncbi:hypothetical protein F5Y04DRAFT_60447 [Hypomontagnella monticulosa]|nr:hypothetical protein F5Y04DRAFT_60447 [Hypomontagnella monticulosa]